MAQRLRNPTSIQEDGIRSQASLRGEGSGVAVSCGVGHRRGSDLALLWLWCRPAAAAPIRPLAWDLPYTAGAALKREKKKKRMGSNFVLIKCLLMVRVWCVCVCVCVAEVRISV